MVETGVGGVSVKYVFLTNTPKTRDFSNGDEGQSRSCLPIKSIGLDAQIIGIEFRLKNNQRGDAAGHAHDFAGFIGRKRAARQLRFPVTQPLLDDQGLITTLQSSTLLRTSPECSLVFII